MSTRQIGANPPGRPALRRKGLPRHVDRRPRRSDGRPEGLPLRAHRLQGRPALGRRARRARPPSTPRSTPSTRRCRRRRRSGSRCVRTCASSPSSSTSRPSSSASGATSRASAATNFSPSAGATRSGSARSSARGASSASCARISTTRRRRCSRSRRRTGRTRGSGPAPTPTSSPTASSRSCSTACAATPRLSKICDETSSAPPVPSTTLRGGIVERDEARSADRQPFRRATSPTRRVSAVERELMRAAYVRTVRTERPRHASSSRVRRTTRTRDRLLRRRGLQRGPERRRARRPAARLRARAVERACCRGARAAARAGRRGRAHSRLRSLYDRTRTISTGRVNGRRFGFGAGIGIDAEAVRRIDERGRAAGRPERPGDLAFIGTFARMLVERRGQFDPVLEIEGYGRAAFVLVANVHPYCFLKTSRSRSRPEAAFEQGLDFLAPPSLTPRTLPPLLLALATGRPVRNALPRPRSRPHRRALRPRRCRCRPTARIWATYREAVFEAERRLAHGDSPDFSGGGRLIVRCGLFRMQTTSLTTTEAVLLGLLAEGERSGYDLLKRVEASVAHIWSPAKSQLYAVLPRLVEGGLARRRTVRQQRVRTSSSTGSPRPAAMPSAGGSRRPRRTHGTSSC